MTGAETYFQVEFYSELEGRWVALFSREPSETGAQQKAREWLPNVRSRVVRVSKTCEVVWEETLADEGQNREQGPQPKDAGT